MYVLRTKEEDPLMWYVNTILPTTIQHIYWYINTEESKLLCKWVGGVGWETWGIGNSCGYTLHAEILKTPLKVNPKGEIISNIQTSSCWYSPKEENSREINFSFLPGGSYANSRILVTTNKHSCLVSYVSHGKQRIWKKEKRERKKSISLGIVFYQTIWWRKSMRR